jgi:hypothetical protein
MFDDVDVAEVSRPAVHAAARTSAFAERAAWQEETPDRSLWSLKGVGDVEVRGASPVMVWYSIVGGDGEQIKVTREEFTKKARRHV